MFKKETEKSSSGVRQIDKRMLAVPHSDLWFSEPKPSACVKKSASIPRPDSRGKG